MDPTQDRRERLERLRDQLADAIASCSENMLPQLAGQYRATLAELASIDAPKQELSATDQLRARREARRSTA